MFLDEVTSGLDGKSAYTVCALASELAASARGLCVCCIIHQPRPEVVALFTRLIIVNGGRSVFSGEVAGLADFWSSRFPGADMPPLPAAIDVLVDLAPDAGPVGFQRTGTLVRAASLLDNDVGRVALAQRARQFAAVLSRSLWCEAARIQPVSPWKPHT